MVVAAVMDTPVLSGPGRQLIWLSRRLRERDVDLRVLTFHRRSWAKAPFVEALRAHGVPHAVIHDRGPFDRSVVPLAREIVASWRPAIVQTIEGGRGET